MASGKVATNPPGLLGVDLDIAIVNNWSITIIVNNGLTIDKIDSEPTLTVTNC